MAGCGTGKTCPCMVQAHTYPALGGGRAVYMCTYTMWTSGGTVASSVTEMMLIGNAAADAI